MHSTPTETAKPVISASKILTAGCACQQNDGNSQLSLQTSGVTVALAGQPNVGKSTVFNVLTGLNQHVGNWAGKTVELKVGACTAVSTEMTFVDLPGTYSLTANSEEERLTRDYIIREHPDAVVMVADASALERNLYLLAELLLLPAPVILALNMMDVAQDQGLAIDTAALSRALGLPVVAMSASKNQGLHELLQEIEMLLCEPERFHPNRPQVRQDHRAILAQILDLAGPHVPQPYSTDWLAMKLLEGDSEAAALAHRWLPAEDWQQINAIMIQHEDAILDIAGGRYEWIASVLRNVVKRQGLSQVSFTERFDRWATHPFWGVLMLLAVATSAFFMVYAVGSPLQDFLDKAIIHRLANWLQVSLAWLPAWVVSLLADGVVNGVGMVITFAPILAIFFVVLGLLEDTGYMARAAFVMDRFMHVLGLHGRSFLPLLLGFGCNVPAITGARIVDSHRGRLLTIMLAPLVPCAARLGVLATLTAVFFGRNAFLVTLGLVALNLVVLALLGIVLDKFLFKGEQTAFIMELPLYHRPNWRTIGIFVWQHLKEFLVRAGTIILAASVVIWALSYLPHGDISNSYMATFGRALGPLSALMGLSWPLVVALLTSFIAKENSLATLAVLFGSSEAGLAAALSASVSPASALSFLAVQMLFIPCVATVAAIKQETHSWRWTALDILLLLGISMLAGVIIYQIASRVI